MLESSLTSLLVLFNFKALRFEVERKTKGADRELSRIFETGEADWSEFRLTMQQGEGLLNEKPGKAASR